MISTETKIVLLTARMRLREWFGPKPRDTYPGRRVKFEVGYLLVERAYGPMMLATGARMRADGWNNAETIRLVIPWRAGILTFRATR